MKKEDLKVSKVADGICPNEGCDGKLVKISSDDSCWQFDEDGEYDVFELAEYKCSKCGIIYCLEIHDDVVVLDAVYAEDSPFKKCFQEQEREIKNL